MTSHPPAPRPALGVLALALLVLLAPLAVRAQDTSSTANLRPSAEGQVVALTLYDGSTLIGRVLQVTPTTVRFASAVGETQIPRSAIVRLRISSTSQLHDGQLWPDDPSKTRLFFAPTGRTLKKGETYFADAYVFFPSFQTGLTDAFTLGAGLSLIPGVGLEDQLYYLTPKLGIVSGPNVNVSIGALVAGVKNFSDQNPFGIVYGVSTFGGEDNNVTTGIGYGFSGGKSSSSAVLMLGGETRVSRNIALLSENYFFTGRDASGLLSGGIRFLGDKLSVDLAGFVPTGGSGSVIVVPYVAFLYRY